jgi:Domain of unknown function (DUF4062)
MEPLVRYQVFVSSTKEDLDEERRLIAAALLDLGCIPAGMELFPASSDDAWTIIKREIDYSDYYIVVSAGRYGSIEASSGLSYTEREYDYALAAGKKILGFIHKDISALPADKCDTEPATVTKLRAFQEKLKRNHVKFWTNARDLERNILASCHSEFKQHPAEGWIRANVAVSGIGQSRQGVISVSNGVGREEAFRDLRERAEHRLMIFGVGMTRLSRYAKQGLLERARFVSIDLLMIDPDYLIQETDYARQVERFFDIKDFATVSRASRDSLREMAESSNAKGDRYHISLSVYRSLPTASGVIIDPLLPSGELLIEFFLYQCSEYRPRLHLRKVDDANALFNTTYSDLTRLWSASQKLV